jgi:hypothetical protein
VVLVQVRDEDRVDPCTTRSAGSGRSTSGLSRGLGVSGTGGRAPAASSIGSTSSDLPFVESTTVA